MVPEYLTVLGGDPNAPFAPAATLYDWLSRDPAEARKYIDDPWSGFEVAFEVPLLAELAGAALAKAYQGLGLSDVTYLGYEGGRHELLRDQPRRGPG
jgi:alpha-beta hydrolase superfamily lysophospholipase